MSRGPPRRPPRAGYPRWNTERCPTVDDVRALVFLNSIIAVASVDDVIALIAIQRHVVAWPGVDDVVADSSEDEV
jgi:hypothetical protein